QHLHDVNVSLLPVLADSFTVCVFHVSQNQPHTPIMHFFFFLLIPPPPTSTLFPYTTLFRSHARAHRAQPAARPGRARPPAAGPRSEEHTSELQSRSDLVCRLLLEKKKTKPLQLHPILQNDNNVPKMPFQ